MTDPSERTARPPGPDPATDVVLDAKGLRALAHPVRVQLVGLLRLHGPSTATRLAERLSLASGVTSYHLRQLAAAGFVEEDTERGNARERWWRAVHRATWFTDKDLADSEPEAVLAYLRSVADTHTLRTRLALGQFPSMPRPWRDRLGLSDWVLRLTPEEARELGDELRSVLSRYRQEQLAPLDADPGPEGAERVMLVLHMLPEPADPDAAVENRPR
ncbi:transcriptional regulator [Streptomyces cinnamoneus]|uniref:Transcriptional regulator n=1 Tax=Streptomyces cinnamoneus TaxID=53446 RepID=A0A2G1XLG4_STRCJ|nr:helix-turn-helix domain-containing protein [Streptomyces cinnamoneus]PHQ52104.1 transcriptional regulator [Streptomyces cinnamoneus]PPT16184.1 ArsR family transcriptional regulator [Streptomyces cinnamoneus]